MLGAENPWRPSWPSVLSIALCAIICLDGRALAQTWYAFQPVDLTIYSAGRNQILGHSHYELSSFEGGAEIRGEARYLDGESDVERDRIEFATPEERPALVSFSHIFFRADGRLRLTAEADLRSGVASCNWYQDGATTSVSETIDFPRDTYAGATVLIPIEYALRQGERSGIKFHVFNCTPKPRVLAVRASIDATEQQWASYVGSITRVKVRPDFGWFTLLATPFLPKYYAWFDSSQDWRYLGGTIERFYHGPALELVREPQDHKPPPASPLAPQASPTK